MKFIQATNAKHHAALIRLQRVCLPHDIPYDKNGWYWLGFDGDEPIAFCAMAQSRRWCDTVYLARAGVLESHRGLGLQKRMISIRESFARRRGYNWVVTDTTDNPASANSLISKGYRLFTPSAPWAYNSSLYWRKRL
jgi:GNAT superfamily N-acetyltransferase